MTSNELFPADVTSCPAGAGAADDLRLLRHYEPVLRFTEGELFLPMPVEGYLERCSLWRSGSKRGRGRPGAGERLCAPGELTPSRLAQMSVPGSGLALRFVERPLGRRELRAWRRDADRPRLAGGSGRFAAVGLLSRFIDAVMRLSLLLRGRVPGGTTAAAELDYRAHAEPDSCPYYARVSRDRGFIASPGCAALVGCSCRGPGRTAAPRSASRSSTTTGATVPAWDRARRRGGARCSSMTRRHGYMTTRACGGWTPATRSAGNARRPARVTSAMGRCGSAGLTRGMGRPR